MPISPSNRDGSGIIVLPLGFGMRSRRIPVQRAGSVACASRTMKHGEGTRCSDRAHATCVASACRVRSFAEQRSFAAWKSQILVIRPGAAFRGDPVDDFVRILDVAGLAVHAVG